MSRRVVVTVVSLLALVVILAAPALGADPSPTAGPPGQQNRPDKVKVEKVPITLEGTVARSEDAEGQVTYTLRRGGTTYTLDGGPSWFYGDDHPLNPFVGRTVTIAGQVAEGSTDVDVETVNGDAIRAAGKPPWAGGWKRVGERHPGWSQEKADRFAAKGERFGGCFPPGQCKEKPARGQGAEESPAP